LAGGIVGGGGSLRGATPQSRRRIRQVVAGEGSETGDGGASDKAKVTTCRASASSIHCISRDLRIVDCYITRRSSRADT